MPRPSDVHLINSSYARGYKAPMVDLKQGNHYGHQPDYNSIVSATPYVRRHVTARLLETPRGFEFLENPAKMRATLKALVELHPKTINGLQGQINPVTDSQPFGFAGEEFEVFTGAKIARSAPTFNYYERYGRPITKFYNHWFRELILDPVTQIPNISNNQAFRVSKDRDLLPDFTGMTVLFTETDPTNTIVDKAWLCTNMHPKSLAPFEGSRDPTGSMSMADFDIEWTAITQQGYGVNELAQKLLDAQNFSGANPLLRPAFMDKITADVLAADNGYAEQLESMAKDALKI